MTRLTDVTTPPRDARLRIGRRLLDALRRRRRPAVLSAATVAVVALAAPLLLASASTPAAAASSAVEWSIAPADSVGPDDRVSLRHDLDPGSSATDAVAVTNLGTAAGEFVVSAGDGLVGPAGAFDVATDDPEDAGSWVTLGGLSDGRVALGPGETRVLPVTITVPADAVPGDHPAGIVASSVPAADDGSGVSVTSRLGVRLHLRVAGEAAAAVELDDVSVDYAPSWLPFAPGPARVTYRVTNTGDLRLGAVPDLTVSGPFGLGATTASGEPRELLPGESTVRTVDVEALPTVFLTGHLDVVPVAMGDDALPPVERVSADLTGLALSWTGLALVVLVAGGVATTLVVRRRRARRSQAADARA